MSNCQDCCRPDHADGLPAYLALDRPVLFQYHAGVCKYQARDLKGNAMFAQIGSRFDGVPLKGRVHTLMLLQICHRA